MFWCLPFLSLWRIVKNGASSEASTESIKLQKVEHYENQQLERSGITEELGQPSFSLESCCLSDSSQRSKRKRSSSLSNDDNGTANRIRTPLKKQRKTEESKIEHQVWWSSLGTLGIADSFTSQATGRRDHQLQLERSGITEELGQPSFSQEPCCLSDSSQSSKRKRSSSLSNDDNGTANRIRTPLKKQRKTEESKIEHQVWWSSLGTSGIADSFTSQATGTRDHQLQVETRMASLFDSLFPIRILPLSDVFESDHLDWLFRSERTEARPFSIKAKKSATATDAFHCSSQCLWPPHDQYLAEAEMSALEILESIG